MSRKPIAAALALLVCGITLAKQPLPSLPGGVTPPTTPPVGAFVPPSDALPALAPAITPQPAAAPPVAPPEPTLDQLLDQMEKLRAQRADLDKQEQDLLKVIQRKAALQKDRMDKLGVNVTVHPLLPAVPPVPSAPREVAPPSIVR